MKIVSVLSAAAVALLVVGCHHHDRDHHHHDNGWHQGYSKPAHRPHYDRGNNPRPPVRNWNR